MTRPASGRPDAARGLAIPAPAPCRRVQLHDLLGDPFPVDLVCAPGQGIPDRRHANRVDARFAVHGAADPFQVRRQGRRTGELDVMVFDKRLCERLSVGIHHGGFRPWSRRTGAGPREGLQSLPRFATGFSGPRPGDLEILLPRGAVRPTCGHTSAGAPPLGRSQGKPVYWAPICAAAPSTSCRQPPRENHNKVGLS